MNNMKFEKEKFSRVLSHGLYWENKTYKLKRSIPDGKMFHNVEVNLPVQARLQLWNHYRPSKNMR